MLLQGLTFRNNNLSEIKWGAADNFCRFFYWEMLKGKWITADNKY